MSLLPYESYYKLNNHRHLWRAMTYARALREPRSPGRGSANTPTKSPSSSSPKLSWNLYTWDDAHRGSGGSGMENAGGWGKALTRIGFYPANMGQIHRVGVPNPDQKSWLLGSPDPGLSMWIYIPTSNLAFESQTRRLFHARLMKGE